MAALDFPSSPSVGQVYPNPAVSGQPQYTWDGEKWSGGTSGGNVYIADAAPAAPVGSLWWESDTGILYVRYFDGDSTQWVAIPGGPSDAVRYGGAQALTSAQRSQARSNIDVTKKNYIINGAMMVSQENGATAGTANGYFPVDQFYSEIANEGAYTIVQLIAPSPGGSTARLRVTVTTADAAVGAANYGAITQRIEGLRVADLNLGTAAAKTFTIQFGVRAPAGTYSVIVLNGNAVNRSYVAEYVVSAGEAGVDVVKSVVIPGDVTGTWPKDNTSGLWVRWGLMAGTTFQQTAGSWGTGNALGSPNQFNLFGTNSNIFDLFDVSLTEGTVAPPFQVPDYASELALCRRYWQNALFAVDFVATAASQTATAGITFSPLMRASPTTTSFGSAIAAANSTTPGAPFLSPLYASIQTTSSAAGRAYWYGQVFFNARL